MNKCSSYNQLTSKKHDFVDCYSSSLLQSFYFCEQEKVIMKMLFPAKHGKLEIRAGTCLWYWTKLQTTSNIAIFCLSLPKKPKPNQTKQEKTTNKPNQPQPKPHTTLMWSWGARKTCTCFVPFVLLQISNNDNVETFSHFLAGRRSCLFIPH